MLEYFLLCFFVPRTKSNPTILERKESDLSISDVCLTLPGKPKMADAAVQVTPYDWTNPYLNSFTTAGSPQNEFRVLNPGHRKSMSLQNTPKILRRSGNSSSRYEISPKHNDSLLNGEVQRQSESEKRRLEDILKNIQFRSSNSLEQRASSEDREVGRAMILYTCKHNYSLDDCHIHASTDGAIRNSHTCMHIPLFILVYHKYYPFIAHVVNNVCIHCYLCRTWLYIEQSQLIAFQQMLESSMVRKCHAIVSIVCTTYMLPTSVISVV